MGSDILHRFQDIDGDKHRTWVDAGGYQQHQEQSVELLQLGMQKLSVEGTPQRLSSVGSQIWLHVVYCGLLRQTNHL
jgi:hypothetical protein